MTNEKHLILVVDDDETVRETMCELLADEGHQVACCENGAEALALLRQSADKVCVVLLDLMMPVMNGWDFRREQLADPGIAAIPVVVITASPDVGDGLGNVRMLRKPLAIEKVLNEVQGLC